MTTQPKKIDVPKRLRVDDPAPYTAHIRAGIRAMSSGTATEGQQVAVFNWLIKEAAGIGTQSFRTDPMETAFAEGRRFVAIQILHLATSETQDG